MTGGALLVDRCQRAKTRLERRERTPLAQQLGFESTHLVCGCGLPDREPARRHSPASLLRSSADAPHDITRHWAQDPRAMRRRDVSESARNPEHRPGAPKSPITHDNILDSASLTGYFKYQHGRRHRDVEALGRPRMGNGDPLVDVLRRRRDHEPRCRRRRQPDRGTRGRCRRRRDARRRPVDGNHDSESSVASITGTRNSEPALALTTFGLYGSTDPGVSTTAFAPAASAERMMVPALPGSARRSATSTKRRVDRHCRRTHRDDREHRLW